MVAGVFLESIPPMVDEQSSWTCEVLRTAPIEPFLFIVEY
jgi:hypothetical protein